ncbi:MAG TPA: aminodeoxychorismate/anthranilate synthase component I, partial [Desulfobacterales bacterium]|nr:aminodeoxychorismate/anthranilate synthase component I [Desulfobacterales bacterium]
MVGRVVDLIIRPLSLPAGPGGLENLFWGLRRTPYAMLLLSGGSLDCSRYSIMGWDPYLVMQAKGRQVTVQAAAGVQSREADPFTVLAEVLASLELPGEPPIPPFSAGGLGFLAYELKNHLERLPQDAVDDLGLPDMIWAFPRRLVVQDRWAGRCWQIQVVHEPPGGRAGGGRDQPELVDLLAQSDHGLASYAVGRLRSTFDRERYLQAVARTREYIRQGHIYQVNLSQRFS